MIYLQDVLQRMYQQVKPFNTFSFFLIFETRLVLKWNSSKTLKHSLAICDLMSLSLVCPLLSWQESREGKNDQFTSSISHFCQERVLQGIQWGGASCLTTEAGHISDITGIYHTMLCDIICIISLYLSLLWMGARVKVWYMLSDGWDAQYSEHSLMPPPTYMAQLSKELWYHLHATLDDHLSWEHILSTGHWHCAGLWNESCNAQIL